MRWWIAVLAGLAGLGLAGSYLVARRVSTGRLPDTAGLRTFHPDEVVPAMRVIGEQTAAGLPSARMLGTAPAGELVPAGPGPDLRPFVLVGAAMMLFGVFIVALAWILGKPQPDDQAA